MTASSLLDLGIAGLSSLWGRIIFEIVFSIYSCVAKEPKTDTQCSKIVDERASLYPFIS